MKSLIKIINVFVILFFLLISCCQKSPVSTLSSLIDLAINGKTLIVETAATPQERSQGLMGRQKLEQDHGMLFIYREERIPSFWMKDTHIPLSIAFIDKKGIIITICDMEPESLEPHSPDSSILYALEVNRGWFKQNGIKTGDTVSGLISE